MPPLDGDIKAYVETPAPVARPNTQVVTDLLAARRQIVDPARWCQGGDGTRVSPDGTRQHCLVWTVYFACACSTLRSSPILKALEHVSGQNGIQFNDSHTHAEVLDLIDRTIARCRAEGR